MDTSDRKLVVYICFLGKNMQAPNAAYLSLDVDLLLGCAVQEYFDLFIHLFKKKTSVASLHRSGMQIHITTRASE